MPATHPTWQIRLAQPEDIPALHALIEASIRGLQANDYTPAQIEGALGTVLGLDTQLIRDQTYYVVESGTETLPFETSPSEISSSLKGRGFSHATSSTESAGLQPPRESLVHMPITPIMAGCGGWSKRKTLFGSDGASIREPELLDPTTDAAKVRAIFVHPNHARKGLGSLILAHVEADADAAGFLHYEMGSTLTGVPLYRLKGYVEIEQIAVPLKNGESLPIVKMVKPGCA